jgi:PKHD-type hydroxylase
MHIVKSKNGKATKATKFRDKLGVGMDTVLKAEKPKPIILEESILEILSHTGVFSPEDCVNLIETYTPSEWEVSAVNETNQSAGRLIRTDYRHSLNNWICPSPDNMEFFDKMLALTVAANQRFQFEVDMFEAIQLARYEIGMHYDWHVDIGPGMMGNRKLSITLQLSDPDSYEGGDLIIEDNVGGGDDFTAPRDIGSVTVFPSFMKHRVTPVTKGVRHSVVAWASGLRRFR